jgi:hypothetical protein
MNCRTASLREIERTLARRRIAAIILGRSPADPEAALDFAAFFCLA